MQQNSDNFTCRHCHSLNHEFEILQGKEEKMRKKLKSLENLVNDLQLKNNLLEEENKYLKANQTPKREEKKDDYPKKVLSVLNDFDELFESQGSQISKLIEDREKLVFLSFNALKMISKQEVVINKMKLASQKLVNYISQKGETVTPSEKEFTLLEIDISILNLLQRNFSISKIVSTANDGNTVSDKEILNIVNELARAPNNPKVIANIVHYITNQINEKNVLRAQIQKEVEEKEKEEKTIKKVIKQLHLSKKVDLKDIDIIIEIKKLKKIAHNSEDFLFIIHEIVNILTKYAEKNSDDGNVKCCIKRLRKWLQIPDTRIDLCHEINFLLGSFNSQTKYAFNDEFSSISVDSLVRKIEDEQKIQLNSCEFERQIKDLTQMAENLKVELNRVETERKEFINKRMKGQISQNSSWTKICSYLINQIKSKCHQ